MTKKRKQKVAEDPRKQFERFEKAVQDMVDAGELSPTEADERFERVLQKTSRPNPSSDN